MQEACKWLTGPDLYGYTYSLYICPVELLSVVSYSVVAALPDSLDNRSNLQACVVKKLLASVHARPAWILHF